MNQTDVSKHQHLISDTHHVPQGNWGQAGAGGRASYFQPNPVTR